MANLLANLFSRGRSGMLAHRQYLRMRRTDRTRQRPSRALTHMIGTAPSQPKRSLIDLVASGLPHNFGQIPLPPSLRSDATLQQKTLQTHLLNSALRSVHQTHDPTYTPVLRIPSPISGSSSKVNALRSMLAHSKVPRASQALARLTHLQDRGQEEQVLAAISDSNDPIKRIIQQSDRLLHRIRRELWAQQMHQRKTVGSLAWEQFEVSIAQTVADQLITSQGQVNVGLIPVLRSYFVQKEQPKYPFETQIAHVLQALEDEPDLVELIESIQGPVHQYDPASTLIRATLNLTRDSQVTPSHARQAALGALLSHVRQDQLESCFATCLAIQLSTQQMKTTLKDFKSILEHSHLVRHLNGVQTEIPIRLRLDDQMLNQPFLIRPDGQVEWIPGQPVRVEQLSFFKSALRAMGLQPSAATIRQIQSVLRPAGWDEAYAFMTTPRVYLQAMAQVAKQKRPAINVSQHALFYSGRFAMVSRTKNALSRVWELGLASLTEASDSSYLKNRTLLAILRSSAVYVPERSEAEVKAAKKLSELLSNHLRNSFAYLYEGNTRVASTDANTGNSAGGFVLYDRDPERPARYWKRSGSPRLFQNQVLRCLRQTYRDLRTSPLWTKQNSYFETVYCNLRKYFASPQFLNDCLCYFAPENGAHHSPIDHQEWLKNTPWTFRSGNYQESLLMLHHERDHLPTYYSFVPSSATELAAEMIRYGRWCKDEKLTRKQDVTRLPLVIHGFHAFSSINGHSSQSKVMESSLSPVAAVQKHCGTLAKQLAKTTVEPACRLALFRFVLENCAPPSMRRRVESELEALSTTASVQQLRNHCLSTLVKVGVHTHASLPEATMRIDTFLSTTALPIELRNKLQQSVLVIADTNWRHELHDRFLCVIPNAGSGTLELWLCNEDGSDLQALDQSFWLSRSWGICTDTDILRA